MEYINRLKQYGSIIKDKTSDITEKLKDETGASSGAPIALGVGTAGLILAVVSYTNERYILSAMQSFISGGLYVAGIDKITDDKKEKDKKL